MTRFICNMKQENPGIEIHFFTDKKEADLTDGIINNVAKIIYQKKSGKKGVKGKIAMLFAMRMQFKEMAQNNRYDIIDIHFPKFYMALTMRYLRKMSKVIIASPWGSDILRVEGAKFKILAYGVLNKCDYITTAAKGNLGEKILSHLPGIKNKFVPMAWGSETIDCIIHNINKTNTDEAKKHFGLSERYVITCGYNAFRAQNHDKMIEAIVNIRSQLPDNLTLLFPVSYGSDVKEKYVAELREKCKNENLDALFIENYLSVKDVFFLRMATDMFVHVQNTDAGCASVQEYLLCEKKVVHGSWIRYKMLEANPPLCYYPVSDFSVLGNVIIEAYHSDRIKVAPETLEYIRHNGWEERRKEWNEFFIDTIAKANNKIK